MNPSLPANSQSVDPNLPGYIPVPRPNIAMDAPSTVPQTNQGGQRKTAAQMHYAVPPFPQNLYITPVQRDQIVMLLRAQGLFPDNGEVVEDSYQLGLPPTMGNGRFYSLIWMERVITPEGAGFDVERTDQLGQTYNLYMDRAIADMRASNPPPVMVRRGDDGSIGFK